MAYVENNPARARGERRRFFRAWMAHEIASGLVVATSVLLFVAILALHGTRPNADDTTLVLFVIPISICAMEFGLRGGLTAAVAALAILAGHDAISDLDVGALALASSGAAFLVVGGFMGRFVDERRALEAKANRHFGLSLDLFGTATFDGRFESLNPAWEQTLGYTTEELCSRPFVEFVHPEDRERTKREAAKLAEAGTDTVNFRNRYRTADGQYRWLEWNVRPVAEEKRLYATARDITAQQQAEEALQNQSDLLERMVRERTQDLEESRLETLRRLAIAAEYRDDDTNQHTQRVGRTAALIARELGLPEDEVELLRHAAPLHDIGKVGISDAILLKRGQADHG
jgi:PAS domain S-box-containing protein